MAKKRVTFKLEKPTAKDVRIEGTFNEWDPDARVLKKSKAGVWSTWMMLEKGRHEYRYIVDGEWTNDPSAEHCPNIRRQELRRQSLVRQQACLGY